MRMRIRLLVLLLLVQICFAEKPWEKKAYQKWSAKDVNQVLSDSPWAKSMSLGSTNLSLIGQGPSASASRRSGQAASMENSLDAAHESAPRITYLVQLRSATPVRQAVARKLQLDANYDSMPNDRRADVDTKINAYLAQKFDDVIVAQVTYTSNVGTYLSDLRRYWMGQTAEQLKGSMYLNAGGEKLEPTSFVVGEGVFQVTFPRNAQMSPGSNLSLEFQNPAFGMIAAQKVLVQFSPKDMSFDGTLTF
jgi:hypothetical protein